ncbi:hypothetical protein [Streptomyces sp. NRRL S-337]|uniref:hypothetical protein n=1 Tax=Streptomyces sp. NRRL S-337 TaxID=1463900 RepID=UPI0004C859D3|nr:hypothetical protein [Streptomyces sp. NRRL S-337]
MAFPQTALPLKVELNLGGTWTDITHDVYSRDQIRITGGRSDEGTKVDAGRCVMTLNNRAGKYSPRNPVGPYYGLIGRNTPVRVSVLTGATYLGLPGAVGDYASTPDTAALDITGDLDVRFDGTLTNWGATNLELIGKFTFAAGGRSWWLGMRNGVPHFEWSVDGATPIQADAPVAPTIPPSGRLALAVTLDVNNGAGGATVQFYTAATIAGPWSYLGGPVLFAGTTSIFNSNAPLRVGDAIGLLNFTTASGACHAVQVRSGIGGTLVANPDFTAQTAGTTSFTDSTGKVWTLAGGTDITNRRVRFSGEVSSWPTRWDSTDVYAQVEAAGILRRYGQGSSPLASTLRRRIPTDSTLVAYWPMEDGASATQAMSPVSGVQPLSATGLQWAGDDTLPGSAPLPIVSAAASISATVPLATPGAWHIEMVYNLAAMPSSLTTLLDVSATGTARRYVVRVQTNNLQVQALDVDGTQIGFISVSTAGFTGNWNRLQMKASASGSNTQLDVAWITIGGSTLGTSTTFAGSPGAVSRISSPFGLGLEGLRLGHLAVFAAAETLIYNSADKAFSGESARDRLERLTQEEGLPFAAALGPGAELLGAQRSLPLLDLLRECEDVDHGILYESRDRLGLAYRDRTSLYNQAPALALSYHTDIVGPLEPTDDDQHVRNDVTVARINGSSARSTLDVGALSTQAPPFGVGRYDDSSTLNLVTDDQPAQHAGWGLHMGTWDETRYPVVRVNLARAPGLIDAATTVKVGDRVTIASPPPWLPPDTIDLIVQGYAETLSQFEWTLEFNATPAGPWNVAYLDDSTYGRGDTAGSSLAAGVTSTATTLSVATSTGPLWTTAAADVPFDVRVGGEVVRVTAVSGTTSPQTFTVTRSINGVVKSQSAGADVRLASQPVIAL